MGRQLALPLDPQADEVEAAMMRAWARSGMRVPFHVAMRNPALAICLRNIAAAEKRRAIRRAARARRQVELSGWTPEAADPAEAVLFN